MSIANINTANSTAANSFPQLYQPRFAAAACTATVITLALFQLMAMLVESEPYQGKAPTVAVIDVWPEAKKERPAEKKPTLQPPPPKVAAALKPTVISDPVSGDLFPTGNPMPDIQINIGAGLPSLIHQDELILGYQTDLIDAWSGGVKFVTRKVQDGMDDYCSHQPFIDWAEDQGYDNFDYHSMAPCLIMNPGRDFKVMVDVNGDGNLVESVIPNSYMKLPEYDRTYNALEFSVSRDKQDGWYLNASYTLAKSEGNIEGYVNSTLEQNDAGLTQDFDHERFQTNTDGYLPNDRRHTLKIYGGYDLTDEIMLSANLNIASGRPVNCNGYVPLDGLGVDASGLTNYGPSAFYCTNAQGVSVPTTRGQEGRTPWTKDVGMSVSYIPEWADNKLTLQATVYNLFNTQEVVKYNETGDYDRAVTRQNLNFKTPTDFQTPRSVDLTVRYNF